MANIIFAFVLAFGLLAIVWLFMKGRPREDEHLGTWAHAPEQLQDDL